MVCALAVVCASAVAFAALLASPSPVVAAIAGAADAVPPSDAPPAGAAAIGTVDAADAAGAKAAVEGGETLPAAGKGPPPACETGVLADSALRLDLALTWCSVPAKSVPPPAGRPASVVEAAWPADSGEAAGGASEGTGALKDVIMAFMPLSEASDVPI